MTHYLQTERLVLRQFEPDEADLLIELDSDPAVMRFLTGGAPTAPDDVVRERVLPTVLRRYEQWGGRFGLLAAQERDSGDFLGWFLLRPEQEDRTDRVELGYRLRQGAWGKGYATEGARALLDKAFSELGVRVVYGDTMAVNTGSQNVMEKVGMTVAETLPTPPEMAQVEGSERGGYRYEIRKEQWEASR